VLCNVSIAGELTERLVAAADSLAIGDPREGEQVELGPLISETQRRRVTRMVDNAVSAGAVRATGGGTVDRAGYFYRPTVLSHVDSESEVAHQEIFGPVVSVETFASEREAVAKANAPDYGLSASVWTNDISRALRVTDELHFGTVWTNTHLATASEMPWVGFGSSGYGRDMSAYALDDHTRTKHVMIALSDQPEPPTEGESR
jgi:acyl-CoA reductase-like NAD-dependent aldehyde dehydrogenase